MHHSSADSLKQLRHRDCALHENCRPKESAHHPDQGGTEAEPRSERSAIHRELIDTERDISNIEGDAKAEQRKDTGPRCAQKPQRIIRRGEFHRTHDAKTATATAKDIAHTTSRPTPIPRKSRSIESSARPLGVPVAIRGTHPALPPRSNANREPQNPRTTAVNTVAYPPLVAWAQTSSSESSLRCEQE